MDIVLVRHAKAVDRSESGLDADRLLTVEGHAQAKRLGIGLPRRGVRMDKLVTSPLVRARQTAEDMLAAWPSPTPELVECPHLAPEGRPRRLCSFLKELGAQSVGLVGHEPDLGQLAAWLVGSKKAHIGFAKAGAALVRCGPEAYKGAGTLVWLVTHDWFAG